MTGDPVSWLLIEPGWTVYDAAGEKVGKVKEVLADEQTDIFHGVLVERGLLGEDEKVVAERIAEIHERPPPPELGPGLPDPRVGNSVSMLRKLLWTGLYGAIGAAATIASRRLASGIWRVATGEKPPAKR